MKSKSELLKKANEEFPEYWKLMRKTNPDMRLPAQETFPTVLQMTVGKITHEDGTEALLVLEVRTEDGETIQLNGISLENHWDTACEFSEVSGGLQTFAEVFATNLIFNIMSYANIEIEEWQDLSN